jgi:hypothetical protein
MHNGLKSHPWRRRKKSNISVALHPIVLAAYAKYASGHGIHDALILNFLRRRPKSDFLRVHHPCPIQIPHENRDENISKKNGM